MRVELERIRALEIKRIRREDRVEKVKRLRREYRERFGVPWNIHTILEKEDVTAPENSENVGEITTKIEQ